MLTNKLNLPKPLVDILGHYDAGDSDYTATSLLQPPRVTALLSSGVEPHEDVSDKAAAIIGLAVHNLFEDYLAEGDELSEERLFIERDGLKISGKFDRLYFKKGHLRDFKTATCTSFTYKKAEGFSEWEKQTNTYVTILEDHNIFVRKVDILVVLTDWSPSAKYNASLRNDPYPSAPVQFVTLNIWGKHEREDYLRKSLKRHEDARMDLPECTPEDRWEDKNERPYALMSPRQTSRAIKLFPSRDSAAEELAYRQGPTNRKFIYVAGEKVPEREDAQDWFIQYRPSMSRRCAFYCPVAHACEQWDELKETLNMKDEDTPSLDMVV